MTVATDTAPLDPTDDEIDAAILAAIDQTGGELVPWAVIRQQVPGTLDQKTEAFVRLLCDGRIWAIKVKGRNYVARGDADDMRIAARRKAEGRVQGVLAL